VQVQQVVLNLVLNSIEAMGSVATSARMLAISSIDEKPKWVTASVTDTGSGLDPDASSKVFDAFYTTKADGIGIGLSICRSIIERHGGIITAWPNHPRGTTFQFSLPVAV
jgi:signal transduction histidine kinase